MLGYPESALRHQQKARGLADAVAHVQSRAHALIWSALHHQARREWDATRKTADAAVALATEQGTPLWIAFGTILGGCARAQQGEIDAGIRVMHRGLEALEATGVQVFRAHCLCLLAETCAHAGQTREGLAILAQALALAVKNGERLSEAEMYRVKGELLQAAHDDPREVEQAFQEAIDVSRMQNAKSLELRATMSLCRVWQGQARQREAHALLAGIYGWFTEGFDTADMTDARALLATLDSGETSTARNS